MSRELRQVLGMLLALLLSEGTVLADDEHARFNYAMNCEGCHLADGTGAPGKVPNMKGLIGYYLHSAEGRAFMVRVPGVAMAPLSDDQIRDLLNWMLLTYSPDQLPAGFKPYTTAEVTRLRADTEADPERVRIGILRRISKSVPELDEKLTGLATSSPDDNEN